MKKYNPQSKTAEILRWTLERMAKLPYRVSLRWAFYRILQEKRKIKEDYKIFMKWTIRARKRFWEGWNPTTFEDDTRKAVYRGGGWVNWDKWLNHFIREKPYYNALTRQKYIIQLWFEASAMRQQFEYYAIPLRISTIPFRGDTSIEHKWKIAKELDRLYETYPDKEIVILYFGDFDPKGFSIPKDALKDIRVWTNAEFRFIRCGLNQNHIEQFNLIENPERPNQYQWEALNEEQAEEIIMTNISRFWDIGDIKKLNELEKKDAKRWKILIQNTLKKGDD